MEADLNSKVYPSEQHPNDAKIKKLEILEKEYHEIINSKIDELVKNSQVALRKKILASKILACSDGFFIIREANNYNINSILTIQFPGSVQEARKEYNLNKLEHVRISNKVKFYSLDYFNYDIVDNYDVKSEALQDSQSWITFDNMLKDGYIRSISDVIEIGTNLVSEKGHLIFRGQINEEWELVPRLFREYEKNARFFEMVLFESLLLGHKSPYSNTFDPIDHLMNFQHFGIPTRLLDWTSDLLIALFFACYDEKEEFNQKDGIIFFVERSQFAPLKLTGIDNIFKQPINKESQEAFNKRIDIETIQIIEPIIKNPRLRVQDGCFMIFSFFPLDINIEKFVSVHDFIIALNKEVKEVNKKNNTTNPEFWIVDIRVDKNFKKSILNELDKEYGISKQSIFVEIEHIKEVSNYYLNLYELAKIKASKIMNNGKE